MEPCEISEPLAAPAASYPGFQPQAQGSGAFMHVLAPGIPWLQPRQLTKGWLALLPATRMAECELPPCSQALEEKGQAALPLNPVTALSPFPRQSSSLDAEMVLLGKPPPIFNRKNSCLKPRGKFQNPKCHCWRSFRIEESATLMLQKKESSSGQLRVQGHSKAT